MTYNLMRVCEEISKIQKPTRIHPSDKKYTRALEKRQKIAKENGGFVNPLLFQARIVRISSYTIRAVQNAIITGMSLFGLMCAHGSISSWLGENMGTMMVEPGE